MTKRMKTHQVDILRMVYSISYVLMHMYTFVFMYKIFHRFSLNATEFFPVYFRPFIRLIIISSFVRWKFPNIDSQGHFHFAMFKE